MVVTRHVVSYYVAQNQHFLQGTTCVPFFQFEIYNPPSIPPNQRGRAALVWNPGHRWDLLILINNR